MSTTVKSVVPKVRKAFAAMERRRQPSRQAFERINNMRIKRQDCIAALSVFAVGATLMVQTTPVQALGQLSTIANNPPTLIGIGDQGWWYEAGKSAVACEVAGAAAGAVASVFGTPSALAGAGVGAVAGFAEGFVTYAVQTGLDATSSSTSDESSAASSSGDNASSDDGSVASSDGGETASGSTSEDSCQTGQDSSGGIIYHFGGSLGTASLGGLGAGFGGIATLSAAQARSLD